MSWSFSEMLRGGDQPGRALLRGRAADEEGPAVCDADAIITDGGGVRPPDWIVRLAAAPRGLGACMN